MGKRLLPLFAALSLLLGACGVSAAPPAAAVTPRPAPTVEISDVTPEPAPEPTPSPTPEPTPTPAPPAEPELTDGIIDYGFFEPAARQGTLHTDSYHTESYIIETGEDYVKRMSVYLPDGYDETQRYDVLFLLHTSGGNERFWLENLHSYTLPGGETWRVSAVDLLDNLIERGLCKPMIVVALCGYIDEDAPIVHNSQRDYAQFAVEFREDILPHVVNNYSTWAESADWDDIIAARRHFGLLGASFGAYMTEISVIAQNLKFASWYALIGGGSVTREYLEPMWSLEGLSDYEIDLLYFVEGEYDDREPVESSARMLAYWPEKFTDGENLRYTMISQCYHEERAWINGLYNAAQLFFRENGDGAARPGTDTPDGEG